MSDDPNTPNEGASAAETPARDEVMQFFTYGHLPLNLQAISKVFAEAAETVERDVPPSEQRAVALQKLLEAKDAAVRAVLVKAPVEHPVYAERDELRARVDALEKENDELAGLGGSLSNVAYNLVQNGGKPLEEHEKRSLDALRQKWDETRALHHRRRAEGGGHA